MSPYLPLVPLVLFALKEYCRLRSLLKVELLLQTGKLKH